MTALEVKVMARIKICRASSFPAEFLWPMVASVFCCPCRARMFFRHFLSALFFIKSISADDASARVGLTKPFAHNLAPSIRMTGSLLGEPRRLHGLSVFLSLKKVLGMLLILSMGRRRASDLQQINAFQQGAISL